MPWIEYRSALTSRFPPHGRIEALANWLKTRGRGYSVSEGDGVFYSYSVFTDYKTIAKACRSVHVINTIPAGINPYCTAGHVALLGLK